MSHRQRSSAETLAALLARPQGMTTAEGREACPGSGIRTMCKRMQHLVDNGKAWHCKVPGSLAHRWFASQAARDAWAAAHAPMPTRTQPAKQRPAQGPSLLDTLLGVVVGRGGQGTLLSDLYDATSRPRSTVAALVTRMAQIGSVCSTMYKHIRIIHPVGVACNAGALQACQRRIDRLLVARAQRGSYAVVTNLPGVPAGVTLAGPGDFRHRLPINHGQVQPTLCPAPKFDHRYQADPGTRVEGGFGATPGQYDTPASNWVSQVLAQQRAAA